jgi:hypothetical protein
VIRPVLEAVARIGRPPVRVVSLVPPHDPEPYPDEPFAPVYDFIPLGSFEGMRLYPPVADPRPPDALVFGPGYRGDRPELDLALRCHPCGVTWAVSQGRACWCCGRPS